MATYERVDQTSSSGAGALLRSMRTQLTITTRYVAEVSREIAARLNNEEYSFSHARLVQIENGESTPSVYKLFSLSAIYARPLRELLSLYIDFAALWGFDAHSHLPQTHLGPVEARLFGHAPVSTP